MLVVSSARRQVQHVHSPAADWTRALELLAAAEAGVPFVAYRPKETDLERWKIKPSAAVLFDELGTNLAWTGSLQYGDIDAAFKSADRVVSNQ